MATVPGRQPPSGKMSPKRTPPRMRRSTRGPEGFLTPSDGATYTPESSRRIPDELLAKIVLAWTIVFFIVFFNTFRGARSVDADLIHSARFLGASERQVMRTDRKSTRLKSSHGYISYAVFCLKKKKKRQSWKTYAQS